jgi:outer membrane protein TolC
VGTRPQFDVLRARVALDTLQPSLIQQRAVRQLAYMRLKQLLDLPLDSELTLTSALDGPAGPLLEHAAVVELPPATARAPVLEAAQVVESARLAVRAAGAQRLPTIGLNAQIQQLAYPSGLVPTGDFLSNWTVGLNVSVPIFTGGRIGAELAGARAAQQQADARLTQVRELAALDTADARLQLDTAVASWKASAGTVGEAVETVRIATLRFREGLSTQIEISDAQLLLQQARANQARAERDLRLARLRVALLEDLPLTLPAAADQPALPTPSRATPPEPAIPAQPPATIRASDPIGGGGLGAPFTGAPLGVRR